MVAVVHNGLICRMRERCAEDDHPHTNETHDRRSMRTIHNLPCAPGCRMRRASKTNLTKYMQNYIAKEPVDLAYRSNERYDYARGVYDEGFGKRDQRPVRHTREVLFLKPQRLFVVRDTLESLDGKPHLYEALWHLDANAVDVNAQTGIVETHDPGANLRMVPFSVGVGPRAYLEGGQPQGVAPTMRLGEGAGNAHGPGLAALGPRHSRRPADSNGRL